MSFGGEWFPYTNPEDINWSMFAHLVAAIITLDFHRNRKRGFSLGFRDRICSRATEKWGSLWKEGVGRDEIWRIWEKDSEIQGEIKKEVSKGF